MEQVRPGIGAKVFVRLRDHLIFAGTIIEIDGICGTVKLDQPYPQQDYFVSHITTKLSNMSPRMTEEEVI